MAGGNVPPLEVDLMIEQAPQPKVSSKNLPYLMEITALVQDQTDVLLVLDSGGTLPVHALYLAAYSSVFSGILEDHFSSKDHKKSPTSIPLPDCSQQEAEMFLCYLYHVRAKPELTPVSARSTVRLAHKFDVRVVLEQCDEYLAQLADIPPVTNTKRCNSCSQQIKFRWQLWVSHRLL
jgi:hypothetical protein